MAFVPGGWVAKPSAPVKNDPGLSHVPSIPNPDDSSLLQFGRAGHEPRVERQLDGLVEDGVGRRRCRDGRITDGHRRGPRRCAWRTPTTASPLCRSSPRCSTAA